MKKMLLKMIPFLIMASFLATGCTTKSTTATSDQSIKLAAAKTAKQTGPVYKGKVVGKSNKAKQISIKVGKGKDAKTIMVKFDDKTKGVEHASKGHAAIIEYEIRGKDKYATVIKPKLAKLPPGVTEIKTAELKKIIDSKTDMVLIDARPEKRYAQAHLPGAINLTVPKMKETRAAMLPKDKNKLLIFYCGGITCGLSTANAGMAKKLGYTNVSVYLEGEPAWAKVGNPLYASNGFVEKGNIVLVDLRSEKKSAAGRIPRSVTIPYNTLDDTMENIPVKAPVVLYSDSDEEVMDALGDLKDEGYKKVSMVSGNYKGWLKNGGKVEKSPIITDISWKRKLDKGEVAKGEFLKVVNEENTSAVILDVRNKDEVAEGMFKGIYAIPLDEIGARMGELPKDKKIYVHCTTGARADMAAQELRKNGYDALYLVADIECESSDCSIEE